MPEPEEDKCIRIMIDCPAKKDGGLQSTENRNREKQDMIERKYKIRISVKSKEASEKVKEGIVIEIEKEIIKAWIENNPDTNIKALVVGYKNKKQYFNTK